MTIRDALESVRHRSVSFREAEIFLQSVLDVSRDVLHAHPEIELTDTHITTFEECLRRREANEPVAYITGFKEFYGREFACDTRALIPRPETEGLIDRALAFLADLPHPARILELGTGCGNIAITLSLELVTRQLPAALIATDVSADALTLAQENWLALASPASHGPHWLQADLFGHTVITNEAPFDLIIANLPYVPDTWRQHPDAQPEVIFQEPEVALFGGPDGLDIYRQFFTKAPTYLAADGKILIEFSEEQGAAIKDLATAAFPDRTIIIHQDYANLDRVLEIS